MKKIQSKNSEEPFRLGRNLEPDVSPKTTSGAGNRKLLCSITAALLAAISAPAANISWVTFHPGDDTPSADAGTAGFTEAPDVAYTRLLESSGHAVTRYVTTGTPDAGLLNSSDLVIISRSVPSGDYETAAEAAAWNGITAPTMILGGYILRNSRLGFTSGGTMADTAATVSLAVNDPAHPVFAGIFLDAGNVMVNPFAGLATFNGTVQRGISVNNNPVAGGGIVLATVATAGDPTVGGMVIGEWQAGATMANGGASTLEGHRLVFLTGSREASGLTAHGAGIYDLTDDGAQMFLNAVNYMTGASSGPLILSVVETGGDTDAPPAKFTGEAFDHPNLGVGYTVPPFGDEVAAFTDRVHEWTAPTATLGMPAYLEGASYIMLQNDNRDNAALSIEITLGQAAFVYILFDSRYPDGVNSTPPTFGGGTQWILDGGWVPMQTGHNRTGDPSLPDEVGVDEGADGAGSGQGINQWAAIYVREVPAGSVTLLGADNAGRNMYGVVVAPADAAQLPPRIADIVPANGTLSYDAAGGVSFTASAGGSTPIDPSGITLILNGEDVSGQLQVTGTDLERQVAFDNLMPNTIYTATIRVVDRNGREATRDLAFNTFSADALTFEAEDWNFDGGNFIDNPVLNYNWADPNSYVDKGVELGIAGIDFVENTPEVRPELEFDELEWRTPLPVGVPQTQPTTDVVRQSYIDAGILDYELTMTESGEWLNYTRTVSAGNYHVAGRFQSSGPFLVRLDKVTGDRAAENQTTEIAGYFLGSNTGAGFALLPATDINGRPVTVALDGASTLRLTVLEGGFNANYFIVGAVPVMAELPTVTLTNPEDGDAVVPGSDLQLTVQASDSDGSVVSVEYIATADDGTASSLGTATSAPFTVVWMSVPEGSYTIVARATDNTGLVAESASARLYADVTPPMLVEARGKPTLDTVTLTFSEPVDADLALNLGNYTVSSASGTLALSDAVLSSDGTQVTLTTALQTVGDEYTIRVNNVTDLAGNVVAANSEVVFNAVGPLLQTDAGFVIWEAEAFDRNLDGGWLIDTTRGTPSGGASIVNPNGYGGSVAGTVVEYDIIFVKTGTHIFWYRASGDNGNDDSAWLRFDGVAPPGRENSNDAAITGFSGALDFVWRSDAFTGSDPMTIEVATAGLHKIGIARREDGSYFDKFIITTDPAYVPTGMGPPATPRQGEPPPPAADITITMQPVDMTVGENLAVTFTADATSDDPLLAYQWQRKVGATFEDILNASSSSFTIDPATLDWDGTVLRARATVTGNEAFTDEVTLTVIPDTEAPQAIGATGDALRFRAVLRFSEPLDPVTAGDASNYTIQGPEGAVTVDAAAYAGSRTVILTTGAQIVGNKYTVTVNNIADRAATPNVLMGGQAKFYSLGERLPQGADGLMVFEAENYDSLLGVLWNEDTLSGTPSGGISMHTPDNVGDNQFADQFEFNLTFTHAGTHYVWWRGRADDGAADSAWLHLNGAVPPERAAPANSASMSGINTGPGVDFVWSNDSQDGPDPMTFELGTAGFNVIGVGSREDGVYLDKFVITTDPSFNPSAFYGPFGPPETREGQPPLPTLTITSPPTLAEFDEGADVQFTVAVSETTRVISRVEYFAGGMKIGEATASPYSFTWENLPLGAHVVTALLTDDVGDSVQSASVTVIAAGSNDVLLLVGNPDLDVAPSDAAIRDRLTAFGFNVVVVDDNVSATTDAIGKRLIINSSTVGSGNVGTKFRDAAIPVVTWEQANQDEFGMTLNTDGTDRGTLTAQTQVEILDTAHPMAAGFVPGPLTVVDASTDYSWGLPNANAARIATVVGNANQVLIYGYDTGAVMADGLVAPARRVHLFLTDNTFVLLNQAGIALFDAALSWAVDEALVMPGQITITSVTVGAGGLTLTWEGGTGPYTIQTKASLSDPWTDLLTTDANTETVSMTGTAGFFQVTTP